MDTMTPESVAQELTRVASQLDAAYYGAVRMANFMPQDSATTLRDIAAKLHQSIGVVTGMAESING
jgi:hypothetical protein